jgi:hypothetical protein
MVEFDLKFSPESNKAAVATSSYTRSPDMIYVLSFLTAVVAVFVSLRTSNSRETRLVLSATIPRSVSSVFAVIGAAERAPVWCRQPDWLPNPLRISVMTPWGARPSVQGKKNGGGFKGPEEIWIRHLNDREFGYRSIRHRDLSYESVFHLFPEDGKCRLTWEVCYQVHRLPDIIRQARIAAAARASMEVSLKMIQRLALSSPDSVPAHDLIYQARRDQVSAA